MDSTRSDPTRTRSRGRWARRAAAVLAALALPTVLAACDSSQAATVTTAIDLGDIALEVAVPEEATLDTGALGSPWPAGAQVVVNFPGHREWFSLTSVSPDAADPDVEPLNGSFPSWGSVAQLPPEATELADPGDFASIHAFTVEYTECTNSCNDYDRPVRFYVLDDGRTFFVEGFRIGSTFEEMAETLRLRS